ncbi:MAG: hypothetical protein JW772_01320 [Candidatus Diapherotrites archaeon]|nr:hypothetical protein [Candidatus Diapherotrites archaeon]
MLELEKTFLAKSLPKDLKECRHTELFASYVPNESGHSTLRIRSHGSKFEITRKSPVAEDASEQNEHTIELSEKEFECLSQLPSGRKTLKTRYYYPHNGLTAEFDVFHAPLEGLVLIDFEFKTKEEKISFNPPDFCLAEVTQEEFVAGGMLCGKSYKEIEAKLKKFGYKKLFLD